MDLSDSFDISKQSGTRGGLEQFNWESLRSIPRKEREHYLGHSLHYNHSRGKGRFVRNDWYSKVHKSKSTQNSTSEFKNEREHIISKEQRIMNKLLGISENEKTSEYIKNEGFKSQNNPGTNFQGSREANLNIENGLEKGKNTSFDQNITTRVQRRSKRQSLSRSLSP